MTSISTVYTDLHTRIQSVLTSHVRIPDPRNLERNNAQFLRKGYGLAVADGFNTERELGCRLSIRRSWQLKITRYFIGRAFDEQIRQDTDLELLEDLQLIIDNFEKFPALSSSANGSVKYISDAGINSVFIEEENFVEITATLETEYFKSL